MSDLSSKFSPKLFFCGSILIMLAANVFAQTPEQIKFYAERIEFGEIEVKRNALFELRNFETELASRVAVPALRDTSEIVRATATHSVVFLPIDEAAQVLLPLLSEESPYIRRETAYALGKVRNPKTADELIGLLKNDKDQEVRVACAVALGNIGDPSAVDALRAIFDRKLKSDEIFLRRAAAHSIGKIAQIIQNQEPTRTTPESFLPDKYKKVRRPKYRRLLETFPVFGEANASLLKTLQNRKEADDVKREAAFALGEIGEATSIEILKSNLRSKDYYLVEICEEALQKVYASVNFANSDTPPMNKTENN